PLLLAWAGEEPGAAAFPALVLERADPEPLHAAAVRAAAQLGFLEAPLRAVPFGGGVAALGAGGLVADWLPGTPNLHDAVPELVQRYTARAGRPPAAEEVEERLATADLDAIAEIDAPAVPDRWRPALRTAASLVRAAAAERWRVRHADARGWPAVVVGDQAVEVSMAAKGKRPEAPAPAPAPMPEAQMGPERRPVTGTAPAPATALKAGQ